MVLCILLLGIMCATGASLSSPSSSKSSDSVELYFGCGCFWHIQHEVVQAERTILGRSDDTIVGLTGYAGGTGPNAGGHVCYPPASSDGKLGHAEVVGFNTPKDKVAEFAKSYWALFVGKDRVDTQDVGRDYRAVLGLPNGTSSQYFQAFKDAQGEQKFEMKEGMGGDADTLGQALVWVYDTGKFPFYQAEVYHQFHDDMIHKYPQSYNVLRDKLLMQCRIQPTHCPRDGEFLRDAPKNCNASGVPSGTTRHALIKTGHISILAIAVAFAFGY